MIFMNLKKNQKNQKNSSSYWIDMNIFGRSFCDPNIILVEKPPIFPEA